MQCVMKLYQVTLNVNLKSNMTDDEIIEKIYNSMPLTAHAIKYATYVYGININIKIYKSEINNNKFIFEMNSNNPDEEVPYRPGQHFQVNLL